MIGKQVSSTLIHPDHGHGAQMPRSKPSGCPGRGPIPRLLEESWSRSSISDVGTSRSTLWSSSLSLWG